MAEELDLVRAELAELAEQLIDRRRPTQPFGAYALASVDPCAELARAVERAVFLEAFENTPELLTLEYRHYEHASVFFVVLDHRRLLPVGTMRVIVPTPAGFKSLDDLGRFWDVPATEVLARVDDAWDLGRFWDVATLAVAADYRGEAALGLVTQGLLQTVAMAALGWGVERFMAILDHPVYRMLQWRIGRPFREFPGIGPRAYLGSVASLPVWGDLAAWERHLRGADEIMHGVLFAGRGLEPVMSAPAWEDVVGLVQMVCEAGSARER